MVRDRDFNPLPHDYMDVGGRVKLPLLLTPLTYIHVGDAGAVTEGRSDAALSFRRTPDAHNDRSSLSQLHLCHARVRITYEFAPSAVNLVNRWRCRHVNTE